MKYKKDKMKRILIIQDTLGGGGAERVLFNILNNMDYTEYKIDLLLLARQGVYLEKLPPQVNVIEFIFGHNFRNVLLHKINSSMDYRFRKRFLKWVYPTFLSKKYDVEISFLEGKPTELLAKSKNKKSKKIAWIHTDFVKNTTLFDCDHNAIYKNIDNIICVSQGALESFVKICPQYNDRVRVLYNLIEKDEIIELAKEPICFKSEVPTIIGVGRLIDVKRFDLLIKAHAELRKDGIDNLLVILGQGEKKGELLQLAKELNVEDTVNFFDFTLNPYPYINNASVLAMTSDYEGLSLVVIEAMILGKPVVATECMGPIELLEDGRWGTLVACNDYVSLKNAIKPILSDNVYEKKCIEKSKERSAIFDKTIFMKSLYELLGD